jgi:hypothetical protein
MIGQIKSEDEFAEQGPGGFTSRRQTLDDHLWEAILSVVHSELASRMHEDGWLVLVNLVTSGRDDESEDFEFAANHLGQRNVELPTCNFVAELTNSQQSSVSKVQSSSEEIPGPGI